MEPEGHVRGRVALAVSGSVAIHRAVDLASALRQRGVRVHVLMTAAATRLVQPLLFEAVTHERVGHDMFSAGNGDPYDHLTPAREAEVLVFAPATADLIGRLAAGLAGDVVTTCALAFQGPRLLCPAMNHRMWSNPFVQRNLGLLRSAGYEVEEPETGALACGEAGPGRLAPVERILARILALLPDAR